MGPAPPSLEVQMQDLTLKHGPHLIARAWEAASRPGTAGGDAGAAAGIEDDDRERGRWVTDDVTSRVHERLFDLVELDADVTLADIFKLMDASPLVQQVFRRDFAEELCAEARKGPVAAKPPTTPAAAVEQIEYLELYQCWSLDTSTNLYGWTHRLDLHGVGIVLKEDAPEHRRKRGERIQWSVSLTPLREMLELPVRVNAEVIMTEDDLDAKCYGDEVSKGHRPDVTLGQVIQGVLYELSFHGGPRDQAEFAAGLKERVAAVTAGTPELVSSDDFLSEQDEPACATMFETLGPNTPLLIGRAIQRIDDDKNAARWFEEVFGDEVIVKQQYRGKTGREFRKAYRAAAR